MMSSAVSQCGMACGMVWPKPVVVAESRMCGHGNEASLTSLLDRGQFF